jgi:hypothetical protein
MSDDLIISALLRISVISVLSAMAEPAAMTLNKSDLVESCYSAAETSKFTLNTSGLALLLIVNEYNICPLLSVVPLIVLFGLTKASVTE